MLVSRVCISDLLLVDIWGLGMIFIDPSYKYPYLSEIRSASCTLPHEVKKLICSVLRQKKHPLGDAKYEIEQATAWCALEEVYSRCAEFEQHR